MTSAWKQMGKRVCVFHACLQKSKQVEGAKYLGHVYKMIEAALIGRLSLVSFAYVQNKQMATDMHDK